MSNTKEYLSSQFGKTLECLMLEFCDSPEYNEDSELDDNEQFWESSVGVEVLTWINGLPAAFKD